ncbi:metallophosphoesterase family protein [Rhizobium terrae]|uniref:metallophosphoesterase family protein n=1 Tax=Rhizobium terrae TaxID=2171756 RepID=UPI0013C2F726|nr:metallophosphoesterase family protein [Rhizobium terrae]
MRIVSSTRSLLAVERFDLPAQPLITVAHGTPGQRIYAIGDLHGHLDLLVAMLKLISDDIDRYPADDALLVFLGDYIDRGPNSRQVIELLCGPVPAEDMPGCRKVFLRGNHEQFLVDFLGGKPVLGQWAPKGGLETLVSYGISPALVARGADDPSACEAVRLQLLSAMPAWHRAFVTTLPMHCMLEEYFFAHAGVDPDRPLSDQSDEDLIWIRHKFLKSSKDFGRIVVHGHTPSRSIESFPNRINVDTGVDMHGRLSCVVLEGSDRHFLQVQRSLATFGAGTNEEGPHGSVLKEGRKLSL